MQFDVPLHAHDKHIKKQAQRNLDWVSACKPRKVPKVKFRTIIPSKLEHGTRWKRANKIPRVLNQALEQCTRVCVCHITKQYVFVLTFRLIGTSVEVGAAVAFWAHFSHSINRHSHFSVELSESLMCAHERHASNELFSVCQWHGKSPFSKQFVQTPFLPTAPTN